MTVIMTFLVVIQATLGILLLIPSESQAACNFDLTALDPEPIVVTTNGYEFLYPAPSASAVSVSAGESIIISCPGGTLTLGSAASGTTFTATCQSGNTFTTNGKNFDFRQTVCSRNPFHTARYTGKSCEAGGREVEIGFVLTSSSFARQVTICFDETNKNSLYASYEVTKSMGHRETGVARPSFIEDDFYNLGAKVNDLYARNGQQATINGLLGLPANSTKYVHDTNNYFLSRGHIAAKADFVYAPQQLATFHYVNAAPQWQTFNGANWATVEANVQDYADDNGVDLIVYTGTYGVTTLPHESTGKATPLYLYADSNGNRALPVPELFWRVAYNPQNKHGVALIGVNNPYHESVTKICTDISSQIKWLTWKPTNVQSGYSYACTVDDFRSKVSYLPNLDVRGLLL